MSASLTIVINLRLGFAEALDQLRRKEQMQMPSHDDYGYFVILTRAYSAPVFSAFSLLFFSDFLMD
jgi:hypothetical protein